MQKYISYCLHCYFTEKNKFEENRAAALAKDINNDDVKTECETEIETED